MVTYGLNIDGDFFREGPRHLGLGHTTKKLDCSASMKHRTQ